MLGALAFAAPASASTFCVPAFFEGCASGGGNQAVSDLQLAMNTATSDGQADTVRLAPGTYSRATSFTTSGSDDLTVIGSGRNASDITSTASINTYVVNLFNTRNVTFRDLSVTAPASFPNNSGAGAAMVMLGDTFERVDFRSRNDGSSGVIGITYGGTFRDVTVKGIDGGSIGLAIGSTTSVEFCSPGKRQLIVEDVVIENADGGITNDCPTVEATVDGALITGTNSAIYAGDGSKMSVRNVLIRSAEGPPIQAINSEDTGDTELSVSHATVIAGADPGQPAIRGWIYDFAGINDVRIDVRNSVFSGFASPWRLEAPSGISKGDAYLDIGYSNFPVAGTATGDSQITQGLGNSNSAPMFVGPGDYRPAMGSPLIDAGEVISGPPVMDTDLAGNDRPVDGNDDGVAAPDVGAFEYQPPAPTCETDPGLCPDQVKPVVSKVRFSFRAGKGGSLRMKLSEASKVKVVLKPTPKGKRKARLLTRKAKAGILTIKLGRKQLKPGKYRLSIVATDAAGNKSDPLVRKVTVKQKKRKRPAGS